MTYLGMSRVCPLRELFRFSERTIRIMPNCRITSGRAIRWLIRLPEFASVCQRLPGKSAMEENVSFQDVLAFWFSTEQKSHWYSKDDQFDAEIRQRFLATYEAVHAGELDEWRS